MIELGGYWVLFINNYNTIAGVCQTLTLMVYNSNNNMYTY
jgi:hypothetical protein